MRSMEADRPQGQQPFRHISQILFGVDDRLAELHLEAREKLVDGDRPAYDDSIREQTELVAGLAGQIHDYRFNGGHVTQEVETFATLHSEGAQEALEHGWDYPRAAFFPPDVDKHGPSTLRQLGNISLT